MASIFRHKVLKCLIGSNVANPSGRGAPRTVFSDEKSILALLVVLYTGAISNGTKCSQMVFI